MEGDTSTSTPDLHEMRIWMLARLYWDPLADADVLMHEFLDGFYGSEATPLLLQHMQLYTAAVNASQWHVCASDDVLAPFFAPHVVLASLALLDTAVSTATAEGRPLEVITRLNKLRLSPWYVAQSHLPPRQTTVGRLLVVLLRHIKESVGLPEKPVDWGSFMYPQSVLSHCVHLPF